MAETLSTQLEVLMRERDRLEQLLMLDVNWRALRQLDRCEAVGQPDDSADGAGSRAELIAALASNRIYAARAKLVETIELLSDVVGGDAAATVDASAATARPGTVASRIVMLDEEAAEAFKTRLRVKEDGSKFPDGTDDLFSVPVSQLSRPPDALEMIEGVGRYAAEMLLAHGVTSFAEIASWTSTDVATWRARLDGLTLGPPSSWIEQAAVLASCRQTRYAVRVRRGEFAALVPRPVLPASGTSSDPPASSAPAELEPRTPPPLPPLRSAVAATGPNDSDHIISAEELIRVLAEPEPAAPPTASAIAAEPERSSRITARLERAVVSPEAQLDRKSEGYARPTVPLRPADLESEVTVASTPSPITPDVQGEGRAQAHALGPRGLVRRLEQANEPERFNADRYAAYRGIVEEASVTIVYPEERGTKPAEAGAALTASERRAALDRFLKALDGKS